MDDLNFLADDHTLLSSQVIHVVALLRVFCEGQFEMARLDTELARQTEVLQKQLAEHFAYEEVIAFPQLQRRYPEFGPRLQAMLTQHTGVHEGFVRLRSALNQDPSQSDHGNLLLLGTAFQTAFQQHATEETQLLNEISSLVVLNSDDE